MWMSNLQNQTSLEGWWMPNMSEFDPLQSNSACQVCPDCASFFFVFFFKFGARLSMLHLWHLWKRMQYTIGAATWTDMGVHFNQSPSWFSNHFWGHVKVNLVHGSIKDLLSNHLHLRYRNSVTMTSKPARRAQDIFRIYLDLQKVALPCFFKNKKNSGTGF